METQERIWNCVQCSQQVNSILFILQQFPCSFADHSAKDKARLRPWAAFVTCCLLDVQIDCSKCSHESEEPHAPGKSSFILESLTHVKYERLIFPSGRDVQGFERHFQKPSPESTHHLGEIRKAPISLPIFHPCL